jgi:hypothetical protein
LIAIISKYASTLTLPRLPSLLQSSLVDKRVILIIDGLDELPPDRLKQAVDFIANLNTDFPGNRIVAAASFECLDGLTGLGLFPVALAAWGDEYRVKLVEKWSQQWTHLVIPYYPPGSTLTVDTHFMNNWLQSKELPTSPFELTLKVWGAYAGDILGVDKPSLIESYLRRSTIGIEGARPALEQLALRMVVNQSFKARQNEANQWISGQNQPVAPDPSTFD